MNEIIKMLEAEGFEVEEVTIYKEGEHLSGFTICKPSNRSCRPVFYENQLDLSRPALTCRCIIENYDKLKDEMDRLAQLQERIEDWDYAKSLLILCVSSHRPQEGTPCIPVADLYQYIRLNFEDHEATAVVNEAMIDAWGQDFETVWKWAETNTLNRTEAHTLEDYVADNPPTQLTPDDEVIIHAHAHGAYGAAGVFLQDTLNILAEGYGRDFYIIPSSIHETIVVPITAAIEGHAEELKETILAVNNMSLSERERLSNNLYRYNIETQKLEIC